LISSYYLHVFLIGPNINDLGWLWTAVPRATAQMCFSEFTVNIWKKIHLYYQQQKMQPWTLLSDGVRFMRKCVEVPWWRA